MAKRLSKAERYIRDVLAGKIVTSKLVRLQVERHERDLKDAHKRGLIFDRDAAQHVIDFFPMFLKHEGGKIDGQPFVLEPFQQAKLWILYGWYWKDTGFRRFRYAYNEEGRGNGKSMLASGLELYELLAFGEVGAHCYSVSTDKETARIVFDTAELMLNRSPYLREQVQCVQDRIFILETGAKLEPVASGADLLLGLRPQFICFDELHVSPKPDLWNIFESAMVKRDNPLLYACTNSGYNRTSVCWNKREYSVKVLTGVFVDDTWFAWICGLDEGDDWEDERNWPKANPGLGVTIKIKDLRAAAAKAKNDPTYLNNFLRFHMSVWTSAHSVYFPLDKWDECCGTILLSEYEGYLKGRYCFGAIDASTTTDISALVLLFPPQDGDPRWYVLPRFFLPLNRIEDRVKRDRVPYDYWEREGYFILTPGSIIDYSYIRKEVTRVSELFQVREICYDRFNVTELVINLESDGHVMVKWGQGMVDMNAPTKRLLELVLEGSLAHGKHPILRWMANNTMVHTDAAGSVKPDKSTSREKIDGIVATIMALGRGMQVPLQEFAGSEPIYL
jgi:phage terminase large subunit-like protein